MSSSKLSVLCLANSDEVTFSYFWRGEVQDPDEMNVGVPSQPTKEQVKDRLVKKGCKDPIVVEITAYGNHDVFGWVDLADVDKVLTQVHDKVNDFTVNGVAQTEFERSKNSLNLQMHAITHAFLCLEPLRDELNKRKIEVKKELMDRIKEEEKKFKRFKMTYVGKLDNAETEKDVNLDEGKTTVERTVKLIYDLLKQMIPKDPYIITVPNPNPNPNADSRIQELEKQVNALTQERDKWKKEATKLSEENESLKKKVAELEKMKADVPPEPKRKLKDPAVIEHTYVFKHPEGVDDDHIYLMRTGEYRFAFFYIEKEFIDKEKSKLGLDLSKDITCCIKTIERHCSSQSEKELTEKYHVRLGEDFFLCTGELSQ